ncbi:unnamed protein product, partial [Iphiclides podalirius]
MDISKQEAPFQFHLEQTILVWAPSAAFASPEAKNAAICANSPSLDQISHPSATDIILPQGATTEGCNKITHLFIKQATVLKKIRIVSIDDIYSKEVYFYTELAKILNHLQNDANIPVTERFNIAKGYEESSEKKIILENLTRKGYKTFNRAEGLTLKCAELSIQQLAKFHGLSLVMQERMPDYYEMKIKKQKYPITFDDDWNGLLANIVGKVIDALEGNMKGKVEKLLTKMQNDYQQYLIDDSAVSVLCHGDYKPHNVMIKEVAGKIVDVIPLDYQLMYHGCPVTDFVFYIFSGTDQLFRRYHLERLKSLYHECMGRFLRYFGMDIETVFPREQFEQMYKERLLFGLMTGTFMSYFVFVPEDDVPDLENNSLSELAVNPDRGFVGWVRGLMDDFVRWGYL